MLQAQKKYLTYKFTIFQSKATTKILLRAAENIELKTGYPECTTNQYRYRNVLLCDCWIMTNQAIEAYRSELNPLSIG